MMHAIGFFHEQSRKDRDIYVIINRENIQRGYEDFFDIVSPADLLGVEYDYGSVMHLGLNAFSKYGQPTMTPRRPTSENIGQRDGLSNKDVLKINRLYNCKISTFKSSTAS